MRIKKRRLRNFWNFFGAIQIISSYDWRPWKKPGYITMTRRQSNNQWSGGKAAHPSLKNSQCKNPLEKFLDSIFWDQDDILLIDYFPKGQSINAEYYSSLLAQLKDISKEKRSGKVTKGVLFLHDNVPAHWAIATQKKLAYLGFQCLDRPPYSPDLAPSDYHPFLGLKKQLKGRHFSSDAELEQRAKKCTELRGEYVEKIPSLVAVACFLPGRAKDLSAPLSYDVLKTMTIRH